MRVDCLLPCSEATVQANGLVDLKGGGTDTFFTDRFPIQFTLPVVVGASGPHDAAEHHLRAQIHDPEMQLVSHSVVALRLGPRPPNLPDGWDTRHLWALGLDVTFAGEGAHLLTVSIDDGESLSHPLFIGHQ